MTRLLPLTLVLAIVLSIGTPSTTSAELAANAVTAAKIAAGVITADKLNVTTLSAITANMGTLTSGTINGGQIIAGAGNVHIDSAGIFITSGSGTTNSIIWSNGADIHASGSALRIETPGEISLEANSDFLVWNGSELYSDSANRNLGGTGDRWQHLYLSGDINVTNFPQTTSDDWPVVYSTGNTLLYRKTNVYSGTCTGSPVVQRGLIVSC